MLIHNYDLERYCLSALLRHPPLMAEIEHSIDEGDFVSKLNRTVFAAIRASFLNSEDINPFAIAERISNLGITFTEIEASTLDYLEELKMIQVNEKGGMDFFKNLKRTTVRREIAMTGEKLQKSMLAAKDVDIDTIISLADKIYTEKMSIFEAQTAKEFVNLFEDMENMIEERGENPVEEFGFMGPFERTNYLYGSLLRDGDITLIAARSGVGKSALSFYYNIYVADKYDIPILHLDAGEMSMEQLQFRAVCMFTGGLVPVYYLETGKWRKNEEMVRMVRDVWPRVKKLRCHFKNIGGMSAEEIVSLIRRYYYSMVGRGNKFVINYDYIKPISDDADSPEWAVMGHFIQKIKDLITNEIPVPLWTSLQLNKSGITRNKTAAQVDDSENSFSISDRIYHQISFGFILRLKLMEELALWPKNGNCMAIPVKWRHLGEGSQEAQEPVRLPDGSMRPNFIHINHRSFVFEEKGDLIQTAKSMGQLVTPDDHHKKGADTEDDADLILQ